MLPGLLAAQKSSDVRVASMLVCVCLRWLLIFPLCLMCSHGLQLHPWNRINISGCINFLHIQRPAIAMFEHSNLLCSHWRGTLLTHRSIKPCFCSVVWLLGPSCYITNCLDINTYRCSTCSTERLQVVKSFELQNCVHNSLVISLKHHFTCIQFTSVICWQWERISKKFG